MEKIAVVTGASRGIGVSILKKLAQENYTIIGTATSQTGIDTINNNLENNSGVGLALNLSSIDSINQFLDEIKTNFAAPTILINNAGITNDNLFMKMSNEQWNSVIDTNLNGLFYLTKGLIRGMMKAKWGRIINISSVVASMGNPGQANYCAAKAGMLGLTKSLALEIASRNITVNAISPGFIQSDMTDKLPEEQKNKLLEEIPMKRMGSGDDIAATVEFLLSESASYITGQTLHVNGGMYLN